MGLGLLVKFDIFFLGEDEEGAICQLSLDDGLRCSLLKSCLLKNY